jgi:cell shape-determining protein MreC
VTDGEILFTSGLAHGLYPEGLPVARLNASPASSGTSQEDVTATPIAGLTDLQYVDVLEWEPQP